MKDFVDAGLSNRKIVHGIKILAGDEMDGGEESDEESERAFIKVRLEVSRERQGEGGHRTRGRGGDARAL